MRVGWLTTAIFGDLSGYFFRNVRDKSSNIIRRYTTPCCHVTYCKMNDLVVVVFQVPYRSYSCKKINFCTNFSREPFLDIANWTMVCSAI